MFGQDAFDYFVDSLQRWVLFWDTMRKRGDNFLEHYRAGQPPVLAFDYEIILDGRDFSRPVNYALVKILDRRKVPRGPVQEPGVPKRPIVVIDPRAGHGPGIGGSKMDSEIGIALDKGHPVYFILYFMHPEPGQTLADMVSAEEAFIEEVIRRHPDSGRPALIGNCQGGWASALMCAEKPGLLGTLVMNGAPLSYWSGVKGANPMRYVGGLCGGVWLADFLSDIGCGDFDGAYLVQNFECLNPANTLWKKQYNLYRRIDTEQDRYLGFERWWGGFFLLAADEMHFIVDSLFIGNRLEQGRLQLRAGAFIDLKDITNPIVVFCSWGDNITPPQQALNWIPQVYGSEREIEERGKVIVYLVHGDIGHLGIFVSGGVARREHTEIIENLESINSLPPGLYEMVISSRKGEKAEKALTSRFVKRTISEMLDYSGGIERDNFGEVSGDFRRVHETSKLIGKIYRALFRPWVRTFAPGCVSIMVKLLHPSRTQYYLLASLNPLLWPAALAAPAVAKNRRPVDPDNPFLRMERDFSKIVEDSLNLFRDARDFYAEALFRSVYGSSFMMFMFPRRPSGYVKPYKTVAGKTNEKKAA